MTTPIYDQLVAELGDPKQFAAHDHRAWEPWSYGAHRVYDLSQSPVIRAGGTRKPKRRKR